MVHFLPVSMEPMLPDDHRELTNLACHVMEASAKLRGSVQHETLLHTIADLVRSMNCYYSNLIEGHHTHPTDINRALKQDFSSNAEQRNLQEEALAHIEVQRILDERALPDDLLSERSIRWIHRAFCERLPDELLWVENPDTGARLRVVPGEMREGDVQVGRHIAPEIAHLKHHLQRFEAAYRPEHLSRPQQVIATACLHHRLLWIHPFYDGNGRVARLLTHAYLRRIGVGNPLWSAARGLARAKDEYKRHLMRADLPRQGDRDGRGNLTQSGLADFTRFFLEICLDQIRFMEELLEPKTLTARVRQYALRQIEAGRLPRESDKLLERAVLEGAIERGRAGDITGYGPRQASTVLNALVEKGLLISDTPKGAVRLNVPPEVLESWFPQLYPSSMRPTGMQKG